MERRTKITIAIVGGVLLVGASIGYYLYTKKKREEEESKDTDTTETTPKTGGDKGGTKKDDKVAKNKKNFEELVSNLGGVTVNKDGNVFVPFNDKKNSALFLPDGRFAVNFLAEKRPISKGTYSNGGKTLKLENGKTATSGSVWGNLLEIIK